MGAFSKSYLTKAQLGCTLGFGMPLFLSSWFVIVSPTITVGLWSRLKSSLANVCSILGLAIRILLNAVLLLQPDHSVHHPIPHCSLCLSQGLLRLSSFFTKDPRYKFFLTNPPNYLQTEKDKHHSHPNVFSLLYLMGPSQYFSKLHEHLQSFHSKLTIVNISDCFFNHEYLILYSFLVSVWVTNCDNFWNLPPGWDELCVYKSSTLRIS